MGAQDGVRALVSASTSADGLATVRDDSGRLPGGLREKLRPKIVPRLLGTEAKRGVFVDFLPQGGGIFDGLGAFTISADEGGVAGAVFLHASAPLGALRIQSVELVLRGLLFFRGLGLRALDLGEGDGFFKFEPADGAPGGTGAVDQGIVVVCHYGGRAVTRALPRLAFGLGD